MTRFTPQWLQSGSYAASQDRRLIGALWPSAASTGCAVTVAGGMALNVAAGQVAVPSQNNTGTTLCTSDAVEAVSPPIAAAPPSGQNRIDLVICQPRGGDLDGGANNDFIFTSVTGTAAASPAVPATPAGVVALYQVFVPGAAAALVAGNLTDVRPGALSIGATVSPNIPRGFVTSIIGPSAQIDVAALTTVLTLTAALVAGRRYRVSANVLVSQQSATGNPLVTLNDTASYLPFNAVRPVSAYQLPAAIAAAGSGFWSFTATATGSDSFNLGGQTTGGGVCRFSANASQILLEDIGI